MSHMMSRRELELGRSQAAFSSAVSQRRPTSFPCYPEHTALLALAQVELVLHPAPSAVCFHFLDDVLVTASPGSMCWLIVCQLDTI